MKPTNRVRKNGSTAAEPSQGKIHNLKPTESAGKVLIPSEVVKEVELAMAKLDRIGNAAVAFVMMNAYAIEKSSEANRGWEDLEAPGFGRGSQELARMVSTDFQTTLTALDDLCLRIMGKIRDVHTPVKKEERPDYFRATDAIDPKRSWYRIESVVGALKHCIDLQAWALCCNGGSNALSGCFEMRRNLEEAYESVAQVILNLLDSFCAVVVALARQELTERRVSQAA